MILLLGSTGLVGSAFVSEFRRSGVQFLAVSRREVNYAGFDELFDLVKATDPELVINAAGFVGTPEFSGCDGAKQEALCANTLLPQTVARVCMLRSTTWAHVSTAMLYRGIKLREGRRTVIERDLESARMRGMIREGGLELIGYTEEDEPNYSFVSPPCGFYSGSKALGEQAVRGIGQGYIWRPGMLLSDEPHPRNLLSRVATGAWSTDTVLPLTHLGDFAHACLSLWRARARPGTYHVINPGIVSLAEIRQIVNSFQETDESTTLAPEPSPFPSSVVDSTKLARAGVKLRPALDAVRHVLNRWARSIAPEMYGSLSGINRLEQFSQ